MSQIYQDGTYLENNPTWHVEDSPWKAAQISKIIRENNLVPTSVAEVGCGAGDVLIQLSSVLPNVARYVGYEVSPNAFELCRKKASSKVDFHLTDLLTDEGARFDIVLAIDVFEHVEDYMGFLRKLRGKGTYTIFHIPLDLSVQSILRCSPILSLRKSVGHIHYFNKETALHTLIDTGYEIVDYFYTAGSIERPNVGFRASLMKLPRKLLFQLNQDLAVRILGGYSLMVLTR